MGWSLPRAATSGASRRGLGEGAVQPLAEVVAFLAHPGDGAGGDRLAGVERPGEAQVEVAAAQAVQQVVQERGVEVGGFLGAKIADQAGLHPAGAGRLGEQEEAAAGHGIEL